MELKYTLSGFLYISPQDDCNETVDAMLATGYNEEFCIAEDFNPEFISKLMEAGFLVMSMNIAGDGNEPYHILLPKLHLVRSALFFENLHIKKSIRRILNKNASSYELKADAEFHHIVDRCVEKHGNDWLTQPLIESIKKIRQTEKQNRKPISNSAPDSFEPPVQLLIPDSSPYPVSFALYHDGKLAAGEFGVICGKVYTSYSGFYDEDNAGTVQIILLTQYLQEQGFSFFDLGMPLDYKADFGAAEIDPYEFVKLFRQARLSK